MKPDKRYMSPSDDPCERPSDEEIEEYLEGWDTYEYWSEEDAREAYYENKYGH